MGCGAHEGRQQLAVFPRLSRTLNSLRTTTASQPQRHKKSGNLTFFFFFFSVSSSASFTPRLTSARSRVAAIPLASALSRTGIITCMQSRLLLRIASERAAHSGRQCCESGQEDGERWCRRVVSEGERFVIAAVISAHLKLRSIDHLPRINVWEAAVLMWHGDGLSHKPWYSGKINSCLKDLRPIGSFQCVGFLRTLQQSAAQTVTFWLWHLKSKRRCWRFVACQQQTEQTEPNQLLVTCLLSFKTQTDASFIYLPGDDGMVTGW